jgi:hypothetical protein
MFHDHLVNFAFIWYIFPALVTRTKTNLVTLSCIHRYLHWPVNFSSYSNNYFPIVFVRCVFKGLAGCLNNGHVSSLSLLILVLKAGLPDGFFSNQIPNVGKFWRALVWKMLIYFMAFWNILQTFWMFYDHLVHFVSTGYIFSGFGILCQEKIWQPWLKALFTRVGRPSKMAS